MGKYLDNELHFYFHKYSSESLSHLANFEFNLAETLSTTGKEKITVKQCVLPLLKTKFEPFLVTFNTNVKIRVGASYIANPFDVCETLSKLFEKNKMATGIGPIVKYDKLIKNGFELEIPANYSLKVSQNVGDLLFQGKNSFENKENSSMSRWYKINLESKDYTFYLICDLLQKTTVGKLQLPLVNTLVVEKEKGNTFSHSLWNNNEGQGEAHLRAGSQKKIRLSIVDREGNLAWMKGGLFFIQFKICI